MSYRHVARAVGVAALALLIPAFVTPSASGASNEPTAMSAGALSAMQRDFGLTADQATAQVAREAAVSRTDDALQKQLGAAWSGSFIDQASGRLVVRTTDATKAAAITAAGAQAVTVAAGQDPKAAKDALDKSAAKAPASVGSWYVEEQTGTLVVETTNAAEAQKFVAASGKNAAPVQVKSVAKGPQLFFNLVGGQAIYAANGGRCSVGFSARSGSTAYVITAGHCTEIGGTWSGYNRVAIGPVSGVNFPGDDFGSIRVNSQATWVPTSQVQGTSSVLGSTAAAVGASTCRSGSTTGYRCGTIQAKNATVNYGGGDIVNGLTRTSACAEPGDSGGSFVSGRQAQGMTSGGSGNCSSGGTTFFQPVNEALSRYGLTLVTG